VSIKRLEPTFPALLSDALGHMGHASLTVPVYVWDECGNQGARLGPEGAMARACRKAAQMQSQYGLPLPAPLPRPVSRPLPVPQGYRRGHPQSVREPSRSPVHPAPIRRGGASPPLPPPHIASEGSPTPIHHTSSREERPTPTREERRSIMTVNFHHLAAKPSDQSGRQIIECLRCDPLSPVPVPGTVIILTGSGVCLPEYCVPVDSALQGEAPSYAYIEVPSTVHSGSSMAEVEHCMESLSNACMHWDVQAVVLYKGFGRRALKAPSDILPDLCQALYSNTAEREGGQERIPYIAIELYDQDMKTKKTSKCQIQAAAYRDVVTDTRAPYMPEPVEEDPPGLGVECVPQILPGLNPSPAPSLVRTRIEWRGPSEAAVMLT
ncbi:hypothetical protein KIPB_013222, partial [Kipferlia bialata]